MLKDFAKYLPFLQTPGKRTKPLDESAQAPAPDAPLPEQEEDPLEKGDASPQPEDPVQEEIPAPSGDQEEAPSQPEETQPSSREDDLKQGLAACKDKLYPEALKAFRRAADWSLYGLGLYRLAAKCFHENDASRNMLNRCMRPAGEDRTFLYFEKKV